MPSIARHSAIIKTPTGSQMSTLRRSYAHTLITHHLIHTKHKTITHSLHLISVPYTTRAYLPLVCAAYVCAIILLVSWFCYFCSLRLVTPHCSLRLLFISLLHIPTLYSTLSLNNSLLTVNIYQQVIIAYSELSLQWH